MIRSRITGVGAYLPKRIMDNHELATLVDTSDDWIKDRTGIHQRHIAAEGEYTSDLATKAAQAAIAQAGIDPTIIDLIIVATETPDRTMPATAAITQHKLGLAGCAVMDIHAACSGFVYGLWNADNAIRAGQAKCVLVIGAETFSRLLDWEDRNTCILFGDGAGAVILQAQEGEDASAPGILATRIYADGSLQDLITTTGGVSTTQTTGVTLMKGREVFRHAVTKMCNALEVVLDDAQLKQGDIDLVVPHQANARIIAAIAQRLDMPDEKVVYSVDKHANTSAASIPLALDVAVKDGRVSEGKIIALQALGAGLTWGACLIRW